MNKIEELEQKIAILERRIRLLEVHYRNYTKLMNPLDEFDKKYVFIPNETYKYVSLNKYFEDTEREINDGSTSLCE